MQYRRKLILESGCHVAPRPWSGDVHLRRHHGGLEPASGIRRFSIAITELVPYFRGFPRDADAIEPKHSGGKLVAAAAASAASTSARPTAAVARPVIQFELRIGCNWPLMIHPRYKRLSIFHPHYLKSTHTQSNRRGGERATRSNWMGRR